MKTRFAVAAVAALTILSVPCARGQGTAFDYQGQLSAGGAPANGSYDFRFKLALDALGGSTVGAPFLTNDISVSNGMFNVAVDFGADIFTGSNYWLEIDVRTNGASAYTALSPLQPLLPAPYAIFANTASNLSGTVSAGQLSGVIANAALPSNPNFSGTVTATAFAGNGATLTNLNPANIGSGTAAINITGHAATATTATTANTANSATTAGTAAMATTALSANTASMATNALTADTATSFIGALSGDVVGTQSATTVAQVGGQTAGLVASGVILANDLLRTNSVGSFFAGQLAGASNTTANGNTGVGAYALYKNLSSVGNTALGFGTLAFSQGGNENTALGAQALYSNVAGSNNTSVGFDALASNTNGNENTALGRYALGFSPNGVGNTAIGAGAAFLSAGGDNNTAVGFQALRNQTNGNFNISLGGQAGSAFSQSESSNIDIGNVGVAGDNSTIRLGTAGIHTNTFIAGLLHGNGAGLTNLASTQLAANQFGDMFVGPAGNATSTGGFNTALGFQAFVKNTSGSGNVATGNSALAANTTGADNTATGYAALYENTSGSANVALGQGALEVNTVGSGNVALGVFSLHLSSDGADNTGLGYYTFSSFGNNGSGGASNIAIGYLAGGHLGGAENNDIDIGNPGVQGESSVIRIGGFGIHTNTVIAGVINGNGAGLTNLSAASLLTGVISTNALPGFQGPNFQAISGGFGNSNGGYTGFIGGGYKNIVSDAYATIGGGFLNTAGGNSSVVAGGSENFASGVGAFIGGGGWDGQFALGNVASGKASVVGGGEGNVVGDYATVGGGNQNFATGAGSFIGGGGYDGANFYVSTASGTACVIGGGLNNTNAGRTAGIVAGINNYAKGTNAFIGGGGNNRATGINSTVGGGTNNVASGAWSSVGGGLNNQATDNNTCVPGGANNIASGLSCFAAGLSAEAVNDHSFVWGDGSAPTISTANDQFMLRASGGAVIYSGIDTSVGVSLPAGSGTWTSLSDRNAKENISAVKPQEALAKVAAMPVSQWSYKTEHGVKHIGPMAQDFYAAFNLGADDRHITTIDESGVALAAIQGLNQKLDQRAAEIQALKKQNELLQQRLDQLQQSVEALGSKN